MLTSTEGIRKLFCIILAIFLLAIASNCFVFARETDGVRILWLTNQKEKDVPVIKNMQWRIQKEVNVETVVDVLESQQSRSEDVFIDIEHARRNDYDLILGLTKSQVQALEDRGISPIDEKELGNNPFQSLQVFKTNTYGSRRTSGVGVLGVPINLSVPLVCVREDSDLANQSHSISLLDIGVTRVPANISFPDPGKDSVGQSVFLSFFLEGKGTYHGWDIVDELDQLVALYPSSSRQACTNVMEKEADIGFTMFGYEDFSESNWAGIAWLPLDRAIPVPVNFASVIDKFKGSKSKSALLVMRWLSTDWLIFAADELEQELPSRYRIQHYPPSLMLEYSRQLEYFPISDLIEKWSSRYGYRSNVPSAPMNFRIE